jgi:flavodoxin
MYVKEKAGAGSGFRAQVFYHSTTGNTKKVAIAIARAVGTEARGIDRDEDVISADLIFLGGAVYGSYDHDLHPDLKGFIARLDPAKVGRVALFKTGFETDAIPRMRRLLASRGIEVVAESFACKGRFFLFMLGHPDSADLGRAADFARALMAGAGGHA